MCVRSLPYYASDHHTCSRLFPPVRSFTSCSAAAQLPLVRTSRRITAAVLQMKFSEGGNLEFDIYILDVLQKAAERNAPKWRTRKCNFFRKLKNV